MGKYLIDTDVIINLLNGHELTRRALETLGDDDEKMFSVITEAELYAGLPAPGVAEAEPLTKLLAAMQRMSVNGVIARRAGLYRYRFGKSHGVSLPDALIAATAHEAGAALITGSSRHFPMEDITVLTVENLVA